MALDEKTLEDHHWETLDFYVDFKGSAIHVHIKRKHKWEGNEVVSDVVLNISQAKELGLRLSTLAHDNEPEP